MTSRRDLLKGAAVAAASASLIGLGHRSAGAQAARSQIDGVLRQGVDARDAAGVVAMVATDRGVFYEGAAGLRALDQTATMTPDTVFRPSSAPVKRACTRDSPTEASRSSRSRPCRPRRSSGRAAARCTPRRATT